MLGEQNNPGYVERIPLPHLTWEKRRCHALRIGKGQDKKRISLCFISGVHGRDWGGPDILVYFGFRLLTAYHCVHVDAAEIAVLNESATWATHQPRSNMNNAVGAAPVESMLRAGVRVCLGNDGFSNAMWEEWKAAYLLHKLAHHDPRRMDGSLVMQMAVAHNGAVASTYFPEARVGQVVPGALADLAVVDYMPPTPLTPGNFPWHVIFGMQP